MNIVKYFAVLLALVVIAILLAMATGIELGTAEMAKPLSMALAIWFAYVVVDWAGV